MKKRPLSLGAIGTTTILFIVIALFFGLIIVKEVPLFWSLDESAHFSRAYQVSEDRFLPQKLPNQNYGGYVPASVVSLDSAAHQDLSALNLTPVISRHDFKHETQQKIIERQRIDQPQKKLFDFPGSAAYSPLAYVAPATGLLTCRLANCNLGSTIFLARVFGLLAYVSVVAFSIWLLRTKKIKWLVFVVGLLPITIFQAAAVSADGPVMALSFLLFAIVVKTFSDKKLSPALIALLVAVAIGIPLIKANYGLLDLSIVPVAMLLWKDKKSALMYASIAILSAAVIAMGWLYVARGPGKAISTLQAVNPVTHAPVSARQQAHFVLHKPLGFGQTLVRTGVLNEAYWVYSTTGEFALNSVQMPLSAAVYAYLIIVCAAFYARDELARYKKPAASLGLVAILTAFSIFGALYLTFTPAGNLSVDGVQGRYFIPLMPFFLAAAAALIPVRTLMSPKTAAILFSASSCALLLSGVIYYGLATY